MRDLYDVYELEVNDEYSVETLMKAFDATCKKRDTVFTDEKIYEELNNIKSSKLLRRLWNSYKEKNYYVEELSYDKVVRSVEKLINDIYDKN
ncbi:Nucleotidyl transferase AbiEii toxin, Type IV TA system [Eubacterium uniforme]|uniref:Nucleotidyl transferase AbiEii toxin, Type IV TA system n=1 Tax=Eubacterium uniforme TaxID=39495 RepID=A0A1T4VL07_9FIRM|nr:nucleotidyl transferase AbiEii/AbiGii toxin family protein [Eubacterium uniforme]SKA65652.1 Nucleotidyl transferase AbiEii toxin, Type IV TA system [Eubacterium uniforme]